MKAVCSIYRGRRARLLIPKKTRHQIIEISDSSSLACHCTPSPELRIWCHRYTGRLANGSIGSHLLDSSASLCLLRASLLPEYQILSPPVKLGGASGTNRAPGKPNEGESMVREAKGVSEPGDWQHKEPRGDKRDVMSLLSPPRTPVASGC